MTSRALVSERTAADLKVVVEFFGVDMDWNRHLFSYAAQVDGRAFEVVIRALAVAITEDARRGVTGRIRENIAKGKGAK